MRISYYQIDAFTGEVFRGNPAGVCPLESWLPDDTMQNIAFENNLSETAFFVPRPDRATEVLEYDLRWFTPTVEVDLCGHATLASGYLVLNHLAPGEREVRFHTASGILSVEQGPKNAPSTAGRDTGAAGLLYMVLPARPGKSVEPPRGLADALGSEPLEAYAARDYLLIYPSAEEVMRISPDMAALKRIEGFGVIVTAPGADCDFVSRFFAPGQGIDEDPVTGSAHSTLLPYWSKRLGKRELFAKQVSRRGGELFCSDLGEQVRLGGAAALYLEGTILLP